jgi:hypothetical protein
MTKASSQWEISRRQACKLAGGLAASALTFSVSGCTDLKPTQSDSVKSVGFASDCEIMSNPVTVYLYADANLKRGHTSGEGSLGRVEEYFERYQNQEDRGDVSFAIKYLTSDELLDRMTSGFDEGDGVIALEDTIAAGTESEVLYGGSADVSVRKFTAQFYERLAVVRAEGTTAEMPAAETLDGEDSADGELNKMQSLPNFKGKIGIPSSSLTEGTMTNRVLARWGLYTDESGKGGEYAEGIADKVVIYDTLLDEVNALISGECQIAFVAQSMTWGDYPGIEVVYSPSHSDTIYSGASITGSSLGGVARDFFEFVVRCV